MIKREMIVAGSDMKRGENNDRRSCGVGSFFEGILVAALAIPEKVIQTNKRQTKMTTGLGEECFGALFIASSSRSIHSFSL